MTGWVQGDHSHPHFFGNVHFHLKINIAKYITYNYFFLILQTTYILPLALKSAFLNPGLSNQELIYIEYHFSKPVFRSSELQVLLKKKMFLKLFEVIAEDLFQIGRKKTLMERLAASEFFNWIFQFSIFQNIAFCLLSKLKINVMVSSSLAFLFNVVPGFFLDNVGEVGTVFTWNLQKQHIIKKSVKM